MIFLEKSLNKNYISITNKNKVENVLDLFIVGGGPIGIACGIEAKKAELNYLIADKGCLVNSLYNYPLNMTFFSTSEKLEIGNVPFMSVSNKPNRTEALEYFRRVVAHWQLSIKLYTTVTSITKENGVFTIFTSTGNYQAKAVVVATGFYDKPQLMNIEGEHLPKVLHYYKEPHPFAGQKIIVVGAANSAVDAALETYRKGADVTMVVREDRISERVKYWVKPDIENRIKEGSIRAFFRSSILKIEEKQVIIATPEGEQRLENDFVLAMTGYLPDFALLEKAGVQFLDNGLYTPFYNPETMETNQPGLYLAGVICGGMETHKWFIENSRAHSELIVKDIVKN